MNAFPERRWGFVVALGALVAVGCTELREHESPPLVFDDPFVTLDDTRATRALALLKRVAMDFQIIYLTTSDRYDDAADAVVELPGPTAVDDAVDDPALAAPESAAVEGAA